MPVSTICTLIWQQHSFFCEYFLSSKTITYQHVPLKHCKPLNMCKWNICKTYIFRYFALMKTKHWNQGNCLFIFINQQESSTSNSYCIVSETIHWKIVWLKIFLFHGIYTQKRWYTSLLFTHLIREQTYSNLS